MLRPPQRANGTSFGAVIAAVATEVPKPIRAHRRDVPRRLERVVMRCLTRDPSERWPDVGALARALAPHGTEAAKASATRVTQSLAASPFDWNTIDGGSARRRHPHRRWSLIGAFVAMGLALTGYGLVRRTIARSARATLAAPVASPSSSTRLPWFAPLPASASTSPEALAAYTEALRWWREGRYPRKLLQSAIDRDPDLGPAHLRLALFDWDRPENGRDEYERALALRDRLSEHDRGLLDAFAPVYLMTTADLGQAADRLDALARQFPDDAEIAAWAALERAQVDPPSADGFERALSLDPGFLRVRGYLAQALHYAGRDAESRSVTEECLSQFPANMECLAQLTMIDEMDCDCAALERDARRETMLAGATNAAFEVLAKGVAAREGPTSAVDEILARALRTTPRPGAAGLYAARVAAARGDFTTAAVKLGEAESGAAQDPGESRHARIAAFRVDIDSETGDIAAAGHVAAAFLARRSALEPPSRADDDMIALDPSGALIAAAERAGVMTPEAARQRLDERVAFWRPYLHPFYRGYVFAYVVARAAATPERARETLASEAAYRPAPAHYFTAPGDAYLGAIHSLAGDARGALPHLEHAARSCDAVWFPIDWMHSQLQLGKAREATGDVSGACQAYAVVVERWAGAKPRSLSAELARARSRALSCR